MSDIIKEETTTLEKRLILRKDDMNLVRVKIYFKDGQFRQMYIEQKNQRDNWVTEYSIGPKEDFLSLVDIFNEAKTIVLESDSLEENNDE